MRFLRCLFVVLIGTVVFATGTISFAGPLELAKELLERDRFSEARPLLEKALRESTSKAEATLLLTRLFNSLGEWEEGVEYGELAVKRLPESSAAHYEYAVALRQKMGNVGKLKVMFTFGTYKKELQRAIDLDPKNANALSERIGFLTNAPAIAGGDLDKAEKEVAKLEALDWRLAQERRINIEVAREDLPAAIGIAKTILGRFPDDPEARSNLGFLLQRAKKYRDADVQFAALSGVEDQKVALAALYQRGRTRVLGNYEPQKAIEFLKSYIDQIGEGAPGLPDESSACWRLGMALEQSGRTDAALRSYKRALALDPSSKQAKKALSRLK